MKRIAARVLAAMLAGMACTVSHAQEKLSEDDLLGEWLFPGSGAVIKAHRCGDRFCGSDIKVEPPRLSDNGKRRSPPGILIPSNLQQRGPAAWHGKLLNIRDGESYDATLKLIDKDRLALVRCMFGSMLCETVTFHRIASAKPPEPEQGAASADQAKEGTPLPQKSKAAAPRPTRADFEAFLTERGISSVPSLPTHDKQTLFRDFLEWRSQRSFGR